MSGSLATILENEGTAVASVPTSRKKPAEQVPPLENGDQLTRLEFERRYDAMPDVKKAELIEGVVYMPSPVRATRHGIPHADLVTILGIYRIHTDGLVQADNSTIRLDMENEPQPDTCLFILPEYGGAVKL